MFVAFKKEIMIIFFTVLSFFLGSVGSMDVTNKPQEPSHTEEDKDI